MVVLRLRLPSFRSCRRAVVALLFAHPLRSANLVVPRHAASRNPPPPPFIPRRFHSSSSSLARHQRVTAPLSLPPPNSQEKVETCDTPPSPPPPLPKPGSFSLQRRWSVRPKGYGTQRLAIPISPFSPPVCRSPRKPG